MSPRHCPSAPDPSVPETLVKVCREDSLGVWLVTTVYKSIRLPFESWAPSTELQAAQLAASTEADFVELVKVELDNYPGAQYHFTNTKAPSPIGLKKRECYSKEPYIESTLEYLGFEPSLASRKIRSLRVPESAA